MMAEPLRDLAEDECGKGAATSAGHSLAFCTPYKHAFDVLAAALAELHP
jgi:hypothetical protein